MTNHHKLLFLQNSDIPNHLSSDITRHTDYTFTITQSMQNKIIMQQSQCKGGISGHHACNTRRTFYKIGRLDIRRQTITPIDKWLALFSQSMPASLYCVPQISLDRGADVRFLDRFSDRFRCRISRQISWAGCHPLEEDWPVKTGDRFEASKPLVEYSWRIIRRQPFPTHATLRCAITLILSFKWRQSMARTSTELEISIHPRSTSANFEKRLESHSSKFGAIVYIDFIFDLQKE